MPYPSFRRDVIISSPLEMALDRNAVDCVIAPLMLEAFPRHIQPLDEIDRILKPMGYLVLLGIVPFSLWGVALGLGRLPCFGGMSGTLTSTLWLHHYFLMRGYQQHVLNTFHYIPPVTQKKWIHKFEFMNEMGKMLWSLPAGFYCLILQKHEPDSLLLTVKNNEQSVPMRTQTSYFVHVPK